MKFPHWKDLLSAPGKPRHLQDQVWVQMQPCQRAVPLPMRPQSVTREDSRSVLQAPWIQEEPVTLQQVSYGKIPFRDPWLSYLFSIKCNVPVLKLDFLLSLWWLWGNGKIQRYEMRDVLYTFLRVIWNILRKRSWLIFQGVEWINTFEFLKKSVHFWAVIWM